MIGRPEDRDVLQLSSQLSDALDLRERIIVGLVKVNQNWKYI